MSRHGRVLRVLRVLLVVLVCGTAAVALAPASSADHIVRRDKRHDVVFLAEGGQPTLQPRRVDPDVVRTRVAHRDHAIVIGLRFANLRRHQVRSLNVDFETDDRNRYSVSLGWRRNGSTTVFIEHLPDVVDCPKLQQHVNVRRDLIRVRIPRGCLGAPRWVRVYMVTTRTLHNGLAWLIDEPLRSVGTNFQPPNFTRRLYPR